MTWHRHRIPEPETPVVPADPGPTYVEVADARRLLEEQMLRGRNKADRTRARWLYIALIVGTP
jgi:hypothetical protein